MATDELVFSNGKPCALSLKSKADVANIFSRLNATREFIHAIPESELIAYFNELGKFYSTDKSAQAIGGAYLKSLADFMKRENLERMLSIALRNPCALDEFVDLGDPKLLFHAQPRGIVVHWIAGNVPLLGFYSLLQALLTKNPCVIKASSRTSTQFVKLLESFARVSTSKVKGSELSKCIEVVVLERESALQEALSLNADARIAWGGKEAITSITSLKKQTHCEDIVFGPKYSYAVVDSASLKKNASSIAQRLAFDVSTFDQYACSSPHTVFVEANSSPSPLEFAKLLAEKLELISRAALPKSEAEPAKVTDILNIRAEYEFKGKVFGSKDTTWTVLYSEEEGLAEACFSRVIFVRPLKKLEAISKFNDRRKQTVGLAVEKKRRLALADNASLRGVDRFPRLGEMTPFESPWDGMFAVDRLVRWVSAYKE
ncbi:MAG: acyl-CoA reductase [Candidatus Micrarchaeota archaeon]